ncbi:MAG: YraN family protein [Bacteroidia bacterium]|nr:YraN family protein [Bacteroidia bacterium]MDW8158723.1 YraN family protein [Bacteroidia bacterium]
MKKNQLIGKWGENWAIEYLQNQNYKILGQNYRTHSGEIDIIAENKNEIIFIEVKTRKKTSLTQPEEAITKAKCKKLTATAQQWLLENDKQHMPARFDVIAIIWQPKELPEIIHYPNAIQDVYFY